MGRALFSANERYGLAPAIRVEPEAVCPYDKWSAYNRFDPDADEFFEGAVFEAFLADQLELPVAVSDSGSGYSDSDSGRDSPLPELSPRPARMNPIWDRLTDESAVAAHQPVDDDLLDDITDYASTVPNALPGGSESVPIHATADRPRSVPITVYFPSTALSPSPEPTLAAPSTPSPRRFSVPPISIPAEPSTPNMESPVSPITPPAVYTHVSMMTPSPPPTVTPRIYMWGRTHTPASPGSPSIRHTHSAGPLTNPGARQSFARITTRRRAQNV
ncbi:hypothetical protein GGX14DRAFT_557028 [Mycena pura]|uniref:Uncharacterized protein n=1 Tax=Mycena pura TaxID=153505 RepID=A0AAD7E1T9_9AGAR|nr:hypothetical protein GGX14DRAFT_557028 [Mycena pura]